jgi:hypothetical protein
VNSSVEHRKGHEVFAITCQADRGGITFYFTQLALSTGGKVYSALVMGEQVDTLSDPDAAAFIDSFKPLVSGQAGQTALVPAPAGRLVQMPPEPDVSYKLCFFAGMFLFAVFFLFVIVYLVRLSQSRNTDYDDDRPRRRRRRRDDEDEEERPRRRRRREEEEEDD